MGAAGDRKGEEDASDKSIDGYDDFSSSSSREKERVGVTNSFPPPPIIYRGKDICHCPATKKKMRRRGKLTCGGVLFLALALAGVAEAGINLGGTGLGSGSSETLTSSKFSIGSALRYLSKAIFIDALAGTTGEY